MIPLIALAALSIEVADAAPAPEAIEQASKDPDLKRAQECRVYTQLAKSIYARNPYTLGIMSKAFTYWVKQTESIGAKYGLSPWTVEMQSLVIKLEQERIAPVLSSCLLAIPKGPLL